MSTQLKTQLSLLLLAGIITVGLAGFLVRSVSTNFALRGPDKQDQPAQNSAPEIAATEQQGAVLGATETVAENPLLGLYVNPFPGGAEGFDPSAQSRTVRSGDAILMSAMQPKPTAPIQSYIRGYVYPIAELDNCASETGCYAYCEQLANVPVCAMFAERQGYMKPGAAAAAQRMAVAFLSADGFSSCSTAGGCVQLCSAPENSERCSKVAESVKSAARVLGASDSSGGAEYGPYNWAGNPYANAIQDYSNPALSDYLASTAGSGCAPLDMICLGNLERQTALNPRVLNVMIDDGGGTGGGGNGDGDGNPTFPSPVPSNCFDNATYGLTNTDPQYITPYQMDSARSAVDNCQSFYQQQREQLTANATAQAEARGEAKKQEAINGVLGFQDCIHGSTNLARDIQRCIVQEIR